jgi:hypothetical protein
MGLFIITPKCAPAEIPNKTLYCLPNSQLFSSMKLIFFWFPFSLSFQKLCLASQSLLLLFIHPRKEGENRTCVGKQQSAIFFSFIRQMSFNYYINFCI